MPNFVLFQFRIALILPQPFKPIVSAESVVISTLPSGLPLTPPASVRAVPVDCTRIRVSWEPGPFPNGPILSYVLRITDNHPNGYSALKVCQKYLLNYYFSACFLSFPVIAYFYHSKSLLL